MQSEQARSDSNPTVATQGSGADAGMQKQDTPVTASVDSMQFRAAMGAFATGVAVITTRDHNGSHGMAVNSLTSLSLNPCMLLFCVKHGSATGRAIRERGAFAVNLLSGAQLPLVKQFCANPEDRFAGLPALMSSCGMPLLQGSLVHICCTIADVHVSGDHDIIVGRVHSIADNAGDPLVFFRGRYGGYQAGDTSGATRQQAAG